MTDALHDSSVVERLGALKFADGLEACERLLSIDGLPVQVARQARQHLAELAPSIVDLAPNTTISSLAALSEDGMTIADACLAAGVDGYALLVFPRSDEDQERAREPALVELGPDLQVIMSGAPRDTPGDDRTTSAMKQYRHPRPVYCDGSWWLCGRLQRDLRAEVELECTRITGGKAGEAAWLGHLSPELDGPSQPVSEFGRQALEVISSIAPTIVHGYDFRTQTPMSPISRSAPAIARSLMPATQAIPDGEGFLTIGSEEVTQPDGSSRVIHRWLWFDGSWSLTLVSPPFVFCASGAERATGLAQRDDSLLVSLVGARGDAWLVTVPAGEVKSILAPPLALGLEAVERVLESFDDVETLAGEQRGETGAAGSRRRSPLTRRRRRRMPNGKQGHSETTATTSLAIQRDRAFRVPNRLPKPTIASVTMTGSNRDVIGDALRSAVDWVDWCLLVDTGITDDTIDVARQVAGDKLVVRSFPWIDDFSAARNFGLAAAAETGAEWAVIVDSDERLLLNGIDIHQILATATEPALLSTHSSGAYTKDRFFRLPVSGEYRGPTHEAFYRTDAFGGATIIIPGFLVEELEKTPEQFRFKRERDLAILQRYTAEHPEEQRWFFYLGDALQGLARYEEAVDAFYRCSDLFTWDEESAWSMYRAAQCLVELDRLEEALEACAYGLTKHSGIAELAWFAGYIALRLGRPVHAVYWAHLAIAIGPFAGIGKSIPRVGWRYQFGRWEGPYDVLRYALRDIGDHDGAAAAEQQYHAAAAARVAAMGS